MTQDFEIGCHKDVMLLDAAHVNQAVDAFTQAFHNDAMCVYIVPDDEARARLLRELWDALIQYHLMFGEVYTTPNVNGIAAWLPPGKTSYTVWRILRSGMTLLRTMVRLPSESRRRSIEMMSAMEKTHNRVMPRPHWFLSMLGVAPQYQGQGIGSALLKPILAKADEMRLPCYLDASEEKNVSFYQKRGFEVAHEEAVNGTGIRVWAMVREPQM